MGQEHISAEKLDFELMLVLKNRPKSIRVVKYLEMFHSIYDGHRKVLITSPYSFISKIMTGLALNNYLFSLKH